MTAQDRLPAGAWVVRVPALDRPPEMAASATAVDHAVATVGTTTVLLGGLLHNRVELAQLLGEAHASDVDLVARGYERWGEGVVERALGLCVTIVCDAARGVVLAARDRLGEYPLFYVERDRRLLLSNSIDALLAEDGVSNAVSRPALVDHLRHVWPFAEETYFEAVRRVPPGNALRRDSAGTRVRRYWDPAPDGQVEWVRPDEIEQFDVLFEQAVARRMSPGPVGVFLSGGLASVRVAALATNLARAAGDRDPLALSLVFPGPEANEEDVQRGVAGALGLEQVLLDLHGAAGPRGLLAEAITVSARAPAPLLNLWTPVYDRLAEAGREGGCASILSGGGGDEWLVVSPFYASDLIRNFDVASLVRLYNEHRRSHRVSPLPYVRSLLWSFGVRPLAVDLAARTLRRRTPSLFRRLALRRLSQTAPSWLAPDPALRRELRARELRRRDEQWTAGAAGRRAGRRYPRIYFAEVRTGLEHPLVAMEFEELYARGRRLGLNFLQPFFDPELVTFLYRTPPELLNAGGMSKALVRTSVARRFPGLGFEQQRKLAATGVVRSMVEDEGRRVWSETNGVGVLAGDGLVDGPALRSRVDEILGNRETRKYYLVWDLLVVESFLRARQPGMGE